MATQNDRNQTTPQPTGKPAPADKQSSMPTKEGDKTTKNQGDMSKKV